MNQKTPHTMQMEKHQAVLCVICKPSNDSGDRNAVCDEVAIFKRSGEVGLYKHKWAAISRPMKTPKESLLDAAWNTIKEETGLDSSDLSLLRPGKPYSYIDKEQGTPWEIWPFAFILKPGAKDIRLNTENTEHKFVQLEKVDDYDTLPNLSAHLRRVLVGPDTAAGLKALQEDHSNGARVLAITGLKTLLQAVEGHDLDWATTTEAFWTGIRFVGWHISKNGRPSMGAAIEAAILRALKPVGEIERGDDLNTFKRTAADHIKSEIRARETSIDALSSHFTKLLSSLPGGTPPPGPHTPSKPLTILTLSSSSTVTKCFLDLLTSKTNHNPPHLHLQIMESRPLFEGATFASKLLASLKEKEKDSASPDPPTRLSITLASDSSAALLAKPTDCVLLGADRISYQGDVSNKTGSLLAVLAAKHVHPDIAVIVVAETDKIAGSGEMGEHEEEDNDVSEVTEAWLMTKEEKGRFLGDERVNVKNVYFEWVPKGLVGWYVTEEGVLEKDDILRISKEREELEKKIFENL